MTEAVWQSRHQFCGHCGARITFPALEEAPVTCPQCRTRYIAVLAYALARPDAPPEWVLVDEPRRRAMTAQKEND